MKTTKASFILFKKECKKWIKFWGLHQWEVHYAHDYINSVAQCRLSLADGATTIVLAKELKKENNNKKYIKECAFHEVCELMLGRLTTNAISRCIHPDDIEESTHEVIRRLENCIYKNKHLKRR